MTRLILIRHGESVANRNHIFVGHTDVDLEEHGKKQAELTAEYIYKNFKIDKIYASDLKRAYDTGKFVADRFGLEIVRDKGLREIYGGKWEGMSVTELKEKYGKSYEETWRDNIALAACDGGESVAELGKRVYKRLTEIAEENPEKNVAIATHATVVRVMQSIVITGGIEKMKDIPWPPNASVTVMEYDKGRWRCVLVSEEEHLKELNGRREK